MAHKTDTSVFMPEERPGLLLEILGILFGFLALLLILALISVSYGLHWIGTYGDSAAQNLFFTFGQYVAYLLPLMFGICAYNFMRGEPVFPARGTGWRRGIGGVLMIVALCALLALSVSPGALAYDNMAFQRGGLIGNFMIQASGLDLARMLGRLGTTLVFSALALIGLVLFTEKLIRDLFGLGWHGTRSLAGASQWMQRFPVRIPGLGALQAVGHALARPFAWVGALGGLAAKAGGLLRGVQFSQPKNRRVLGASRDSVFRSPSAEPRAPRARRPEPEPPAPAEDDEYYGPTTLEEDEEYVPPERPARGGKRFSTVFPRPAAPAPAGRVVDEPPAARGDEEDVDFDEPETGTVLEAQKELFPDLERLAAPRGAEKRRKGRDASRAAGQGEMDLFPKEYRLPGLDLLADPPAMAYEMSDEEKDRLSRKIEQTLAQFKVQVEVLEVIQGPVITRFALRVAPGVRVNRILALESELAMALKATHVRILAPIPGQSAVGIEVPNKKANPVMVKDLLDSDAFRSHKSALSFALGKNIAGEPVICDLAQMPHLLIAGTTGSGKSVCLNCIIASMLYKNKPDRVKFVMVDPKRVELSIYQAIPHLIAPVVSETKKAAAALAWCVEQMESRYKILASLGVRNLDSYNALLNEKVPSKKLLGRGDLKFLPHIVIIIDELADLMMVAKNEVEEYIIRLAQMARAVGMHLVLATQRPSVNVITGIIKANFPSRIAFQVSSKVDSRTILDMNGAEALLGRGDMLYSPGGAKPFRIQGAYLSDSEVERLADYIREQEKACYEKEDFEVKPTPAERAKAQLKTDEDGLGEPGAEIEAAGERVNNYLSGMAAAGRAGTAPLTPADMELLSDNDLYEMALKLVLESRKASVSYIQRRMKIGYARAGRLMDMMEDRGIVGPYQGSKPRELRVDPEEFLNGGAAEGGAEEDR